MYAVYGGRKRKGEAAFSMGVTVCRPVIEAYLLRTLRLVGGMRGGGWEGLDGGW